MSIDGGFIPTDPHEYDFEEGLVQLRAMAREASDQAERDSAMCIARGVNAVRSVIIILIGAPNVGKTHFAQRFMQRSQYPRTAFTFCDIHEEALWSEGLMHSYLLVQDPVLREDARDTSLGPAARRAAELDLPIDIIAYIYNPTMPNSISCLTRSIADIVIRNDASRKK